MGENTLTKACVGIKRNIHLHRFKKGTKNFKILNVDTLSYKTKSAKPAEVDRKWFVIDVEGEVVGRMCYSDRICSKRKA